MTERQWIARRLARPVVALLSQAASIYDVSCPEELDPAQAADVANALRGCVEDINAEIARYDQRAGKN